MIYRTARNHYMPATQQDIERGGAKRTTRRVERAQLQRETQRALRDWRASDDSDDD